MSTGTIRRFLLWCTVLNGGLLILLAIFIRLWGGWMFAVHAQWIPLTREDFHLALYLLAGVFKLLFIVFNLTPWLALVILERTSRRSDGAGSGSGSGPARRR